MWRHHHSHCYNHVHVQMLALSLLTPSSCNAVGFNTSSVQWDWVGVFDFIAGRLLLAAQTFTMPTVHEIPACCLHFDPRALRKYEEVYSPRVVSASLPDISAAAG